MSDGILAADDLTGNLDAVSEDGFLLGWCFRPSDPTSRRRLAVELDAREVAIVIADQTRPDLVSAGLGDGAHAFSHQLPAEFLVPLQRAIVSIRDTATGRQVGQDVAVTWQRPLVPEAPAPIPDTPAALSGNLDRVTRDGLVSGWCWYPEAPGRRVDLLVFIDDEQVGEIRANHFRADLRDAGIGDGAHGFSFALPWSVLARKGTLVVSVREQGTGTALGERMTLRFGHLALAEERIEDLERQLRVLRATQIEERRDRHARDGERAARDLFRTVGAFFQGLADAPPDAAGIGVPVGLRDAVADIFQRFPAIAFARAADPAATICIDADLPIDLLYGCMVGLRDAGADALADIVLLDDGKAGAAAALLPGIVRNLGYARNPVASGRNALARDCRGAVIVFLAAGLRVTPEWLPTLLATMDREKQAAIVASPVLREDGMFQHFGLMADNPGGRLTWRDAALGEDAALTANAFLREVDAVADSAYAVRRDAFTATGGLFENFETPAAATLDLCLRLRRAGGGILVQPKAPVVWPEELFARATGYETARAGPDPDQPTEDVARIRQRFRRVTPLIAGRALVIDTEMPRPDRDAGSVAVMEHMRLLRLHGYRVTFIAANDPRPDEARYIDWMERRGIEVARAPGTRSVTQLLGAEGSEFSIVQINRHSNATLFIERIRVLAPKARVIFSPLDLHFLREQRERTIGGREPEAHDGDATREAELAAIAASDATLLLSDAETDLLRGMVDPAKLHLLRWIVRPIDDPQPFARRADLCFVGNFRHGPNVDAVQFLATEIMPLLLAAAPALRCHVVGGAATDAIAALASDNLIMHGWVENLDALLGASRVSVAPLRYGAGFKGKVAASLACGTPVVGTSIAFEGTGLADGDGVRQADDAAGLARAVLGIVDNEAEWIALSARGIERCGALYSPEAGLRIYAELLSSLGLPSRSSATPRR